MPESDGLKIAYARESMSFWEAFAAARAAGAFEFVWQGARYHTGLERASGEQNPDRAGRDDRGKKRMPAITEHEAAAGRMIADILVEEGRGEMFEAAALYFRHMDRETGEARLGPDWNLDPSVAPMSIEKLLEWMREKCYFAPGDGSQSKTYRPHPRYYDEFAHRENPR